MSSFWKRDPKSAPHILSGAVLDPCGLDALLPDWREMGAPINVPVKEDNFYIFGQEGELRLPNMMMPAADEQPRQLHRFHGQCLSLDG